MEQKQSNEYVLRCNIDKMKLSDKIDSISSSTAHAAEMKIDEQSWNNQPRELLIQSSYCWSK